MLYGGAPKGVVPWWDGRLGFPVLLWNVGVSRPQSHLCESLLVARPAPFEGTGKIQGMQAIYFFIYFGGKASALSGAGDALGNAAWCLCRLAEKFISLKGWLLV